MVSELSVLALDILQLSSVLHVYLAKAAGPPVELGVADVLTPDVSFGSSTYLRVARKSGVRSVEQTRPYACPMNTGLLRVRKSVTHRRTCSPRSAAKPGVTKGPSRSAASPKSATSRMASAVVIGGW